MKKACFCISQLEWLMIFSSITNVIHCLLNKNSLISEITSQKVQQQKLKMMELQNKGKCYFDFGCSDWDLQLKFWEKFRCFFFSVAQLSYCLIFAKHGRYIEIITDIIVSCCCLLSIFYTFVCPGYSSDIHKTTLKCLIYPYSM